MEPGQAAEMPHYQYPEYVRAARKLDAERGWQCWCEYKYTDTLLEDILAKYGISVPLLYKTGARFGDDFRRGRGKVRPCPLSPEQFEAMRQEYLKGELTLPQIEEKYGVGMQWVYKDLDHKGGARRRPDRVVRLRKRSLSEAQERSAWAEYEACRKTVREICSRYKIDVSTLYDIGDRLGSTFRRHSAIAGDAVTTRYRYYRNRRAVGSEVPPGK